MGPETFKSTATNSGICVNTLLSQPLGVLAPAEGNDHK